MELSWSAKVHTAETAALAVLEVRVHLDLYWNLLPEDYVLMEIKTCSAKIEESSNITDSVAFGNDWLDSLRSPLLSVTSVIILENRNILINPAHPEASALSIALTRLFKFDPRLWHPT